MNKVIYKLSNGKIVNTYSQAVNSGFDYTKEYVKVEDEYTLNQKKVAARKAKNRTPHK